LRNSDKAAVIVSDFREDRNHEGNTDFDITNSLESLNHSQSYVIGGRNIPASQESSHSIIANQPHKWYQLIKLFILLDILAMLSPYMQTTPCHKG
jgi:hypothetical protein